MASIFRREPGRLEADNLVRKRATDAAASIANEFFEAGGAGPQNVTLPTIASSVTLFGFTVYVKAGFVSVLGLGAIRRWGAVTGGGGLSLSLPAIASVVALFAPSLAAGAVGLALPTIASGATTSPPTLRPRVALPTIASTATTAAPTLRARVSLPTISTGAVVRVPTLRYRVALPVITGAPTLSAPTLRYRVALPTLGSGAALTPPTLVPEQLVILPTIGSGAALSTPIVTLAGGGTQFLSLPTLASSATTAAPTLRARVVLPIIGATSAVSAPTLRARVALPTIAATSAVTPPVLVPEFLLVLPTLDGSGVLYAPTVAGGSIPEPTDPPIVRRWKDWPRARFAPIVGFDLYNIRHAAGTITAGAEKTRLITVPNLTSRQAWIVTVEGPLEAGVYLQAAWLTVPGTLALVYVNAGAVDRFQDLHDVNVMVLARSEPI